MITADISATDRLAEVQAEIERACKTAERSLTDVSLIAVSKTFGADRIRPVIEAGHRVFGENRVQESQGKWPALKAEFSDLELHLIGPLQSNKARDAVALFDVIQTVDREKIAKALAGEIARHVDQGGVAPRLFVQVNTGEESQKAGISPPDAAEFVSRCGDVHGLKIEGLMCIPPFDEPPGPHFALLADLATECGLETLSMGMSADYSQAIMLGATHIRVGSAIFGPRD
ncbi:MAG: YggS family pyridoxal phosphate-dependent enzyme [Pseudomonadota bacterium]